MSVDWPSKTPSQETLFNQCSDVATKTLEVRTKNLQLVVSSMRTTMSFGRRLHFVQGNPPEEDPKAKQKNKNPEALVVLRFWEGPLIKFHEHRMFEGCEAHVLAG